MQMLSDAQAQLICGGGGSADTLIPTPQPTSRPSTSWGRPMLTGTGRRPFLSVIQFVFSPQINISFVVANNGSTAIGGNQSNRVFASFA
jgi:hypothetical protein